MPNANLPEPTQLIPARTCPMNTSPPKLYTKLPALELLSQHVAQVEHVKLIERGAWAWLLLGS
eukprot:7259546-Prymnesium_polylepis.1